MKFLSCTFTCKEEERERERSRNEHRERHIERDRDRGRGQCGLSERVSSSGLVSGHRSFRMWSPDSVSSNTHRTNDSMRNLFPFLHRAMEPSQRWKMTIPPKGHSQRPLPLIPAHGQSDNLNSNGDIQLRPKHTHGSVSAGRSSRMTFSALGNFTEF